MLDQLSADDRLALLRDMRRFLSPGAFEMTGEDNLQISVANSLSSCVVTVAGRFLTIDGEIIPFLQTFAPTTGRTVTSVLLPFGDGWLLNATAFVSTGAPLTGQTFVRLQVIRGAAGATLVLGTLAAGYVTAVQPLAYPANRVRSSLDGQGVLRSIAGTDPAAGTEISETVPTGARWRLLALSCRLVTSAAVANRSPILLLDDGAAIYFGSDPGGTIPASQNFRFTAGQATQRLIAVTDVYQWTLPNDHRMLAGHRWRTSTQNIQAADDYSNVQYLVEEWLEGAA